MANILVLYSSGTGNTEKMALFVYKGAKSIPGANVRLRRVDEADEKDLKWCDGLACGSQTNFGGINWQMTKWWHDKLHLWPFIDGKFGCAFSSNGAWGGGAELCCMELTIIMLNFGFLCFGLTDFTGPKFSAHYGAVIAGEPISETEFNTCVRLGKRLSEWCTYFVDGQEGHHPLQQSYDRLPPTPEPVEPIVDYPSEIARAKATE